MAGGAAETTPFEAAIARAEERWPGVQMPRAAVAAFLRERCEGGDAALDKLHVDELYLAFACLSGDEAAWRAFDRTYLTQVPAYVARVDRSPAFADEIRQRLSEKLLETDEGPSKLESYTGKGPLGAWLRVVAVREALNAKRGVVPSELDAEPAIAARDDDPEIQLLKRRYAREFTEAFREVLAELEPDQRSVLRLHYLDGLTLEEVGKAFRVSRATAARWIADAKRTLIERVHVRLGERLGAEGPGAQSLISLVRSQLHLSLRRHFADPEDPT